METYYDKRMFTEDDLIIERLDLQILKSFTMKHGTRIRALCNQVIDKIVCSYDFSNEIV